MYHGFRKSRWTMLAIEALTVALSIAVWVRDRGRETYIPIIASVLLLAIGFLTARIVANIVASTACTDALGLLHMEMKPEEFLKVFSPVPGRIPKESKDRQIASLYLSDGYWAAGKFRDSLEVLGELPQKWQTDTALAGTWYTNRCRAELALGDCAAAKESLKAVEDCIAKCGSSPKLMATLQANHGLMNQYLRVLQNEKADSRWLQKQLDECQYTLRRLEILQVLSLDALNTGERKTANKYLTQMQQLSGGTFFHGWAAEKEKTLTR